MLITDYNIETMAIFTTWVKIGSTEYFFNPKYTCGWAGQNFYHNFWLYSTTEFNVLYNVRVHVLGYLSDTTGVPLTRSKYASVRSENGIEAYPIQSYMYYIWSL